MDHHTQDILEKFVQGCFLSRSDLHKLRSIFNDDSRREEVNQWLSYKWENAESDDIEISYDGLKRRIREYRDQQKPRPGIYRHLVRISSNYQRIAAILFIPLVFGMLFYLFFAYGEKENFYISEAPLGQKAKIELPDKSTIWLNSGSRIRYSSGFIKNRRVELTGEAYFDVKKAEGQPFYVSTPFLDVEVTGTQFNINAYDDEACIKTGLVEGKVNVILKNQRQTIGLEPGKVLSWSKETHTFSTSDLNEEVTTSWKENRLIFINDDFSSLVRKMEKWYNVDVVYDPGKFKDNKLTVQLLEGEQLDQLLKIIETAIGARCTISGSKIYITKN